MNNSENSYWHTLKNDFMNYVKAEILSPNGEHKRYRRSMDLLMVFAVENGYEEYLPEVGMAFYESEKSHGYKGETTLGYRRATIRHLNTFLFRNNYWQRNPRNVFKYNSHIGKTPLVCPNQFSDALEEFLDGIGKLGLKEITVQQYRRSCTAILCAFDFQGVKSWDEVTVEHLTTAFKQSTNKYHFISYSKRLFQFLVDNGLISANYALILPRMAKKKCLPSVYSDDEIKNLLENVERFTPQGKRDYAMLLMALRLGLRQSDIRLLCFENVDFENSQVNLVQFKTGVAMRLSLPEEVATALHDYINNGREETVSQYIFLNGYGSPLTRHAVSHIASRHFKKANIDIGVRHHGAHSLRMTFASQLIAENVPYEVVRVLLGHVCLDSTKHYVEFSTEGLRTCALEVPQPGGAFAEYLSGVRNGNRA